MTVDEEVDRDAEEAKVEDVVLKNDNCRLGVNSRTLEFLLNVEGREDIA